MSSAASHRRELNLFVASPSDVQQERKAIQYVADQINELHESFFLKVEMSQTSTVPALAHGDPQGEILYQMDHFRQTDIFLLIMWRRLGTPVVGAASGTVLEFETAHALMLDRGKPRIMVYFCTASVEPSQIDLRQLEGLRSFQERVKKLGLISKYKNRKRFRYMLFAHLWKTLEDIKQSDSAAQVQIPRIPPHASMKETFVEHLAEDAQFTEDQIARFSREFESRERHRATLDTFVTAWNPGPRDDPDFQSVLFAQLATYTPPMGFPKLLRFLQLTDSYPALSAERHQQMELQRKALCAMESYFPAAPASPDSRPTQHDAAFTNYVDLLTNLLDQPEHSAYAIRTLLRLGVLPLGGEAVASALTAHPPCTSGILQHILDPARRVQLEGNLSQLYNICLGIGSLLEQRFRVELASLGGKCVDGIEGPRVLVPGDQRVVLIKVGEEHYVTYSEISERRTNAESRRTLRQVLDNVEKGLSA
jgi:hypothetical protein